MRSNPDRAQRALKENLRDEPTFERSMEEVFYGDSLREVMADLGYREDIDTMIGSIKIDEDFLVAIPFIFPGFLDFSAAP